MRVVFGLLTVVAACALCACDKAEESHASHEHTAECKCAEGKKGGTVWCERCKLGYVKGKKTSDRAAVQAAVKK